MSRSPNIVVFQTDDHAQWALPSYGGTRFAAPHISALAESGVVFDNAYTPTPVCSPARASLLTGLMSCQHGIRDFLSSAPGFHDKEWMGSFDTLPEQLARQGYTCAHVGKWHQGNAQEPAPGFHFWHAMSGKYPIHHTGDQEFSRAGTIETEAGVLTDLITDHALGFLEGRKKDDPFFLYVGYYATHSPWDGHPENLVPSDEPATALEAPPPGYRLRHNELQNLSEATAQYARAQYRAAVAEIDRGVGQVLSALPGDEDTLIIYTSDHGLSMGQNGVFGKGNATTPQNLFDENIRIPMILSWPGTLPQGKRDARLCDLTDLYATLRQVAGVDTPEQDGMIRPGTNMLSDTEEKTFQVCEYGNLAALIDDTGQHELRRGDQINQSAAHVRLQGFYKSLDVAPPWTWDFPDEPSFNFKEAWRDF